MYTQPIDTDDSVTMARGKGVAGVGGEGRGEVGKEGGSGDLSSSVNNKNKIK